MRRTLFSLLAGAVLAACAWVGVRGAGPVPPLGTLLDPANGAWAAARRTELPRDVTVTIPNLSAPVDIRYDRRGVPHIFAATELDAIRALGWAAARDRLFQMEAQTRAASGRTSEWAGARALAGDRGMRQLGIAAAAERQLSQFNPASMTLLDAYADGVNAWIDGMSPADWPIEYRLLGAVPERWSPVNTMLLFGRMGWTLAYGPMEQRFAAAAGIVGREAAAALFPPHSVIVEPIQPNGTGRPRFDFRPLPPPGEPDSAMRRVAALFPPAPDPGDEPPSRFASNNWAVSPGRTAAGHALLSGDPHLQMTLPSIWYEAHLVVPGSLDVYGVTIPGAPGIIIGFTRDIAWSFTNTGADVLDFYRETVDDPANPTRYQVDGEWRAIDSRIEAYHGTHGEVIDTDTLRFTHRGPLSRAADGSWMSMRWTVLDSRLRPDVFLGAAHAMTAHAFLDSMAAGYGAPAQNMIAADRQGSIAIRSTGHYPIRPAGTSGVEVQDGSRSANDWLGFWPVEQYPQSLNPAQGYLASANQEPIDPRVNPTSLGVDGDFDPWRALHINRLLRADSSVTPDAMRRYQTDPGSDRADRFVPYFLDAARAEQAKGRGTPSLDSAAAVLASWDRRYTRDNVAAALFEGALRELSRRTWDELVNATGQRAATPSADMLLNLLQEPTSRWWDDRSTGGIVEDRDVILAASLAAAHDSLVRQYGSDWTWSRLGTTRINHLLGLPAFSVYDIAIQGGPGTLNPASRGGAGPSWRMVVELADSVRAWGTYPGGQSGNPVSARYTDRVPLWAAGELDTLIVPRDTASLPAGSIRARARLTPGGGSGS